MIKRLPGTFLMGSAVASCLCCGCFSSLHHSDHCEPEFRNEICVVSGSPYGPNGPRRVRIMEGLPLGWSIDGLWILALPIPDEIGAEMHGSCKDSIVQHAHFKGKRIENCSLHVVRIPFESYPFRSPDAKNWELRDSAAVHVEFFWDDFSQNYYRADIHVRSFKLSYYD